jgi:hypothetical protein
MNIPEAASMFDALLRERHDALPQHEFEDAYGHWLPGGDTVDTLAGTAIPGGIRMQVGPFPWELDMPGDELPMLDLSWSPPDPVTILDEILERLGVRPKLVEPRGLVAPADYEAVVRAWADAWPGADVDAPTREMRAIPKEEQ